MAHCRNDKNKDSLSHQDEINIPEEELQRVITAMMQTLELGICVVYGDEDTETPDAVVNCDKRLNKCKSICCSFQFALTKEEVQRGHIKHDIKRPFFIARDLDKYCHHLNRHTLKCDIWNDRPLRCRKYDCSDDPQVWSERPRT